MPSLGSGYASSDDESEYAFEDSDESVDDEHDEDPDPNIEQLQRELNEAEEAMQNEMQTEAEEIQERANENERVEQIEERPNIHSMNLRENRKPIFKSYKHPEFDNVEYQMFQEEEQHMHDAYIPQQKAQLSFKDIKDGAAYTIEQLAAASYKHVLTQMMAHQAIKKLGHPASIAMLAEYGQLDDKRVYSDDVDQDAITDEDDRNALNPIDLVKVKRDGRVKGRSCVDGRKQREFIPKEQCASPTIANSSLMLMMSIAAKEGRKIATADVAGAYLHADMDDYVLVKFTGTALDLMCKVNPKYENLVRVRNGKRVMYLRLAKALYG